MKKILIISPHFPPSNLAAVHRSRLFAQHLPQFGWEPIILTIHENFYEEKLDPDLQKLIPSHLRIEKTEAYNITKPRLIGDIGLRGFFQLYKKAKNIIRSERIDFVYILIPSFYCALLGRWLHKSTRVKYGIDYIDPWVHDFPGSEKMFSRHWWSKKLAGVLELIAVKNASLITGVSEGYYTPVLYRNPHLKKVISGAMPYGGEKSDYDKLAGIGSQPYIFKKDFSKIQLVYAGAMLPKAYLPLEAIFKAIKKNFSLFHDVEFYFIGTGKTPDDESGFNIKILAEKYKLWQTLVFEYPKRIPYMDVLIHLNNSTGIFILGSTEPHYTPSKIYQAILSEKPILAVLNQNSSAVDILLKSRGGIVLTFDGYPDLEKIEDEFPILFKEYLHFIKKFEPHHVDQSVFDLYSAKNVTGRLVALLEQVIV